MVPNRLWRTLSAFNRKTRSWEPIPLPLQNAQGQLRVSQATQSLSLISWNIDAFSSRPVARAKRILGHILDGLGAKSESESPPSPPPPPPPPDIIFFQEVTPDVRTSLLDDARVRAAFLATDAGSEDRTSFEDVPFATMTLLSSARFGFAPSPDSQKEGDGTEGGEKKFGFGLGLGRVSRVTLPSKYKRDALCVDIILPTATATATGTPGTVFRLINVHLDSLWDTLHYRAQQLEILADVLREPGCGGGIIAGDFNAISPEDYALVGRNGLVDAWVALHDGRAGAEAGADPDGLGLGATWGVGVERRRRDGLGLGRLDKVAMMGLVKAEEMQVHRPGAIEVPRPGEKPVEISWSDHCGLRCTFTICQ